MTSSGNGHILPSYRTRRRPDRYTDGPRAGRVIARKTGKITSPWQQYVLDVGLERVDGPGSPFAYSTVDCIVGRRCGKSLTLMGVPLFRGLAGPAVLDTGQRVPFTGAHTAQNLVKARQRFMKDLVEPFRDSMSPALWRAGSNLRSAIGDTSLRFDPATSGKNWESSRASTISIFAPTISAVRGDGLLHLGFDEVLVFTGARGVELMAAARPTLATMRGHGQIWRASNVTRMNDASTWLWDIRDKGRAQVAADATTGTAYFEFTIPEDADPADPRVWWEHYPALSDGLLREEELAGDLIELGVGHFAAEYLGRWPGAVARPEWAAIDRDAFMAAKTTDEMPADQPAALAVDLDPLNRAATIAAGTAGMVEIIDHRPGIGWVEEVIRSLAARTDLIVLDDYGPNHDLFATLEGAPELDGKLRPLRAPDVVAACASFDSGIREAALSWRASDHHRRLIDAASAAERTPGKAWQYERRVATPQTPLLAAALARYAADHFRAMPDPEIY